MLDKIGSLLLAVPLAAVMTTGSVRPSRRRSTTLTRRGGMPQAQTERGTMALSRGPSISLANVVAPRPRGAAHLSHDRDNGGKCGGEDGGDPPFSPSYTGPMAASSALPGVASGQQAGLDSHWESVRLLRESSPAVGSVAIDSALNLVISVGGLSGRSRNYPSRSLPPAPSAAGPGRIEPYHAPTAREACPQRISASRSSMLQARSFWGGSARTP